jgi:hypothetical protein
LTEDDNINNVDDSTYQGMADTIMAEIQHNYNLRPKNKPVMTTQPKKFFPRGETYDPTQKEIEMRNKKGVDSQNTNVKEDETQVRRTKTAKT